MKTLKIVYIYKNDKKYFVLLQLLFILKWATNDKYTQLIFVIVNKND